MSTCPTPPTAIAYYAEFADKLYDEVAPTGPDDLALIRREPLGVVAAIVPWNYPLIISAWKLGPALLAGNSVVLKPAEQSPLSAHPPRRARRRGRPAARRAQCRARLRRGGRQAAGAASDVDMVSFTGSTEVGKLMLRYAGESNLKRVALECGGKSPHVVMADADLEAAADGIAWGIYYNAGETCHAGSRLIVHRAGAATALLAGDRARGHAPSRSVIPFDPATQMGALIDQGHMQARARLHRFRRRRGRARGASAAAGADRQRRLLCRATVLDGVRPHMRVSREEIFGPVLAVSAFRERAEALQVANDTLYGLAAAVWTPDMNARPSPVRVRCARGTVWVNSFDRSSLATPFGGFKQSGFGRDRSPHAIDKYVDLKTIWTAYQ